MSVYILISNRYKPSFEKPSYKKIGITSKTLKNSITANNDEQTKKSSTQIKTSSLLKKRSNEFTREKKIVAKKTQTLELDFLRLLDNESLISE